MSLWVIHLRKYSCMYGSSAFDKRWTFLYTVIFLLSQVNGHLRSQYMFEYYLSGTAYFCRTFCHDCTCFQVKVCKNTNYYQLHSCLTELVKYFCYLIFLICLAIYLHSCSITAQSSVFQLESAFPFSFYVPFSLQSQPGPVAS